MLEIELCRICLADSIRMYRIEHTRYHELFEWYTEDTMDMNAELPYAICYLCNAVLNRLYDFLKNMINTEMYLKDILRNTSMLTLERIEQLKREMIKKPHNLSKIRLRNSNFIVQKSILPASELKSHHRTQKESSEHNEEKSLENEDQQKRIEEKFENQPTHTENDSKTTADLSEFANDDETISIEEDITLVWSPEIENESNIPDMDLIENLNHKSESNFSNMSTKTPDSIDSFLLCAKKYRPPKEIAKPSNENVTKNDHNPYVEMDGDYPSQHNHPTTHLEIIEKDIEIEKDTQEQNVKTPDPGKFHNPDLQFIEEHIATEEKPKQSRVKTPEPVNYHNPYLQFIEERIPTEDEPPKKSCNTSEQRVKTSDPEKYLNQNYMEIDKQIDSNMPSVQQKSTELTAIQLEKNYYSLYLEPVKETPLQKSNEPIEVIKKSTPVGSRPNKPILKLINPTTANVPAKIIVTSEPKKYINSYVDFVKDIEIKDAGVREHVKESNQEIVSIPPKKIRMCNIKKKSSKKVVPITPVQEKLSEKIVIQIGDYSSQHNHPTTDLEFIEKNIEIEKDTQEKNVKTQDPGKFHNPYLQFIEERIATEEKPKQRRVKTPEPVKYHNPYLQFIEERIPTEDEPPKKSSNTSEQRVKTSDPEKYQNQNYMEIDKQDSNMPSVQQKSTELTAIQLEKNYYSLYLEPVKETPLQISHEPIEVIEKSTPVGSRPNKPIWVLINPTTANEPANIIVTSEPKKYINSYGDFVKDIKIKNIGIREHVKESNQEIVPISPKKTRKRKIKSSIKKIVRITTQQEKLTEKIDIDGKISGYSYFDHQKRYHRASILRKSHLPKRNKRETKELAEKIKNRAAILTFQKTGVKAGKVVQKNGVIIPAPSDESQPPGISKLQTENTPTDLALKSKEHSDKLLNFAHDIKNRKIWHVVEYPVNSKHTDIVTDDECKDKNQGGQYNAVIDQGDQNNVTILEDQEDTNSQIWSDQEEITVDSQVDRALKVLDESLKDEDKDAILQNEGGQGVALTDKNDTPLQLKDVCIIIDDDLEDENKAKDQDNPSLVVQNVFTLEEQGLEDEDLIQKEQYDEIIMLANQDDQVMDDGNVAVKIEAVDEEFQGTLEENNEVENLVSDTETFDNKDIMDPNNDSNDIIQHGDIKLEVEQNMQIDDQVSECEPYLQERVNVNENTTQKDRGGPSNYEKPDFESNYNEIDALNEQEHYAIRSISQISLMPTVQLERLPIGLIKRNKTKNNVTADDKDRYSCARCDFKTTVRVLLFRHQNVHDLNKPFVCSVCQHRFLSHYHLSRHKVIHDRSNYYCAYCDFKTTMKLVMDKHQNVHNKLTRFPCHWCKRRFRSASHRARHFCTNKHSHICKVCSKSFKHEASYLRHLDKHAGVVPMGFKCNACHESFDSKGKYLYHYELHARKDSENLIHKCKWCNKGFRHKGNCNKHMKLHEKYGEMVSLETEDKQDMYEKDDEMELNEKETTMEDDKFVCGLCTKSFDTEIELGKHAVDHIL